jgi:hypothetical protein
MPDDTKTASRRLVELEAATDLAALEQRFKEAIGGLPNYKREAAFQYASALRTRIALLQQVVYEVADSK